MLEAMAAGLPVVATYHGGIPEAVTNGADGLLVPERSPEELAKALDEMMSNNEKFEEFSVKAAESVRERFGFEGQILNLEDIYREAMGIKRHERDMTPPLRTVSGEVPS